MKKRALQRVVGQVVLAAMPTLALTTACRTTGEATYVVRANGRTCQEACATLGGSGAEGSWRVGELMECVEATEVAPTAPSAGGEDVPPPTGSGVALSTPVAVCRMRTHYMGGIGRRPDGLVLGDACGASLAGAYFARMEQLERAAVLAFARTERELVLHGAPAHLVRDVRRARRDEERHAALAARWRVRLGGVAAEVMLATEAADPRSLVALARENATEGCVHERWGAVLAWAHARGAAHTDPRLAHDLASIAADEIGHAALSERIDRWLATRLSRAQREALGRAREDAIAEVHASLAEPMEGLDTIGWPSPATRARLFDESARRFGWRVAA